MPSLHDLYEVIDKKPFFDQPVKADKKHLKKLSKFQEMMTMQ